MLYIYQCLYCQYKIEKEQSIKDEKYERLYCPCCRRVNPVKRLICGGTSFILKGSGWAKDGYQKKKLKKYLTS